MSTRIPIVLGIVCIALGGCAVLDSVKESAEPTIASLKNKRVELEQDQGIASGREKARETYRAALASTANPRMEAEALRRLADLELEFAEDALIDSENMPGGHEFDDAIALYESVLARDDGTPVSDKVLYQLARAQENAGRESEALLTLDRLVNDRPDSAYRFEAQFRRGEMLFRAKQYAAAEAAYANVLAAGSDNSFYASALYKHGWAQFKQSLHEESLASFFDLLDHKLVVDGELQSTDKLGKAERELVADSLRAVSISLSYFAQPSDVDAWLSARNPVYLPLVYTSLADLYVAQERYADAAHTLDAFVLGHPLHASAPAFQLRVIETWRAGNFPSQELEARDAFVTRYAPGAAYWSANDPALQPAVLQAVARHLGELAAHYHAAFQALAGNTKAADARAASGTRAIHYYAQSLEHFPARETAGPNSFMMAELLFELQRFDEAAAAYERAAYAAPDFEQRAEAGYAALLAYNEHEKSLSDAELAAWRARYMDSALRFADTFGEHPEVNAVLLRVAEDAFVRNDFKAASLHAGRILQAQPPADQVLRVSAMLVSGHARFEEAEFSAAEASYANVLAELAANDPRRLAITEKLAAAVYKQGEGAREQGAFLHAAQAFARAATIMPGSDMAAVAEYDAADMLLRAKSWTAAAATLGRFVEAHPEHELSGDARRRLVAAHEGSGDKLAVARALLMLSETSSDPAERETSLWQGAERLAALGESAQATAAFEKYVERFADRFDAAMEARHQLVVLNQLAGNAQASARWQREILATHKAAGRAATQRSQTLAAGAAMALALPLIDQYKAVDLKAPLKTALKKKKARMETALAALTEAADFQILDVTTRATFEIAGLYAHMGTALMNSERPRKLNAEELDEYELLLEEQAFPFEEKAIVLHEANVARLADGSFDQWIQSSLYALATLMPARYAKRETSEDAVVQIY